MARRQARTLALRVLFQVDVGKTDVQEALEQTLADEPEEFGVFARDLATGTLAERESLDEEIGRANSEWSVQRMPSIDRNVLRLALHELRHSHDVPAAVIIDEAVDLAKTYSTAESGRFVNGVLAKFAREWRPQEVGEVHKS